MLVDVCEFDCGDGGGVDSSGGDEGGGGGGEWRSFGFYRPYKSKNWLGLGLGSGLGFRVSSVMVRV